MSQTVGVKGQGGVRGVSHQWAAMARGSAIAAGGPLARQPHPARRSSSAPEGRMNCVSGGSASLISSIQASSWAVCTSPLNAVRCSLGSLEVGRGVATAEPTSSRRD